MAEEPQQWPWDQPPVVLVTGATARPGTGGRHGAGPAGGDCAPERP